MKLHSKLGYFFISIFLFLAMSCDKIDTDDRFYGVVLTVDDGYVDQWYEYMDYFEEYNVKLTFYITNYQSFTYEQILKLKEIAKMGHEIAFHGTNHVSVTTYLEQHTMAEYIEKEIVEGLDAMKRDSFTINHFAYPYGIGNSGIDPLLKEYFTSIRRVAWTNEKTKLKDLKLVHYTLPCTTTMIKAAGIDSTYNVALSDITEAIDEIAITKEAIMLYCHKLSDEPGKWNISVEKMKGLIEYCYYKDVPMLSLNEMYSGQKFLSHVREY